MKNIEPFNKVWLDCRNNMKISLLKSIKSEYEVYAYENKYEYHIIEQKAGSGLVVSCVTEEQSIFDYERFALIEKSNPILEEDFLSIVVKQLEKENGFLLMKTDLYDWMEGSVCWHTYHWGHYALLVDYDFHNDEIIAFDEARGQYKKLTVKKSDLYKHVSEDEEYRQYEKLRLITLDKSVVLPSISIYQLIENAKSTISSIDKCLDRVFWRMEEDDYENRWYQDLNAIYLQKIEGRQRANVILMDYLKEVVYEMDVGLFDEWKSCFERLANEWQNLRMKLLLLYQKKANRIVNLNTMNKQVSCCLTKEKETWLNFIDCIEKVIKSGSSNMS